MTCVYDDDILAYFGLDWLVFATNWVFLVMAFVVFVVQPDNLGSDLLPKQSFLALNESLGALRNAFIRCLHARRKRLIPFT